MASVHKRAGSRLWYAAFTLPDGRRTFRATGQANKKQALAVALKFEEASRIARAGRLTEQRARTTIADIFEIASGDPLPTDTFAAYAAKWLQRRKAEVADSSYAQYDSVMKGLTAYLGGKVQKPMDAITQTDATAFRDDLLKRLSPGSVLKYIKISRMLWAVAVSDGACHKNVFTKVTVKKASGEGKRRAFTADEMRRILEQSDTDWRGAVLLGYYTGQRLGDIADLTWRQVDLERGEIHFVTRKTGAILHLPMHAALKRHLMERPSSDDPNGPLLPTLYGKTTNTNSRAFNELLQDAGLAVKKDHQGTGKGRDVARNVTGLSFHCLRHTATSGLKNAGVSDVVARSIIGHESEAISRVYTHIEPGTMRAAVDLLPELEGVK